VSAFEGPLREWLMVERKAESRGAMVDQETRVTETLTPEKDSSAGCKEVRG